METNRDIPEQYRKFKDMNAYAEIWQDKTKTDSQRERALANLYNECLKYANNGTNKKYTVLTGFSDEQVDKMNDYLEEIDKLAEQIQSLKQSGADDTTIRVLKSEKAALEAKVSEITEWKEYHDKRSREKHKKEIENRWKTHEMHYTQTINDYEAGWFNVIDDAFMEAKAGYENGAVDENGERKLFSHLFISSILNAKKGIKMKKEAHVNIKVLGDGEVIDMNDPEIIVLNEKARDYLKKVRKELNVKGYQVPDLVASSGALAKQLRLLGFDEDEASSRADEVLAKRNISMDQVPKDDTADDCIAGYVSSYLDSNEAVKERKREGAKNTLMLLSSFCKLVKDDQRISKVLFKDISYALTKMYFNADVNEDDHSDLWVGLYDMIDIEFLELLRKDKKEAELTDRKRAKEHVLLAQLLGLEDETARKKLNKASKVFLEYFNEWEKQQNDGIL